MPLCELEINFLVDLKEDDPPTDPKRRKKLVAREAFREWTTSVAVLEGKVSRRTTKVDALTNEIYQLVGLYGAFVSVMLTVVQTGHVQCWHIWSPIVLCSLACFITCYAVNYKFIGIGLIRDEITIDDRDRKRLLSYLRRLKVFGHEEFDFSKHAPEDKKIPKDEKHHHSSHRLIVIGILAFSTLVLVASFFHILCLDDSFEGYGNCIPPS